MDHVGDARVGKAFLNEHARTGRAASPWVWLVHLQGGGAHPLCSFTLHRGITDN